MNFKDIPFTRFLERQFVEGFDFVRQNPEIILLLPEAQQPPARYLACFRCRGFAITRGGEVREHDEWLVEIRLPEDYLASVNPLGLARVASPSGELSAWHPNIAPVVGNFCPGHLPPGTPLVWLLRQLYDVITWQRAQPSDCLNPDAALWAMANRDRWPLPRRELVQRTERSVA